MYVRLAIVVVLGLGAAVPVEAKEHPSLARARALYNAADYDAAISAAAVARSDPSSADASALVSARSHLERYRLRSDEADLIAAREAFGGVRATALSPRDQIDLLVGLGQALYLDRAYGAAAELFDTALSRGMDLGESDRVRLLDWWATAVDREAQMLAVDRRAFLLQRSIARMEEELRRDPANPVANYWLAVASRDSGDLDRAWHASIAAWVRASLRADTAMTLRADIDRFVTDVLIPERARRPLAREQAAAAEELRAEWTAVKQDWK
jgi:hypothetical protein